LFEDQMSSDFLQDLVCTCKGRSVCSKGCVCFEFRSIWHHFNFPFGSYSLDISFRLRSTELSMSEHSIREKSLNWLGVSYRAFNIDFPITLFSKNGKPKWALVSNRTYYEH
jgi:hypothetical protein